MLTYTGTRPFQITVHDDVINPGDTVPESHPRYEYLRLRGDFAESLPAQPPGLDNLPSSPVAPEPIEEDETTPTGKAK